MFPPFRASASVLRLAVPDALRSCLAGIGQIYFQSSPAFGAILLLCLYLTSPALAAACLLGVCVATLSAWALEFPAAARLSGQYGFNAALSAVGLCVSYQINAALLTMIVLVAILSVVGTHACARLRVAPLTFQFVLVMWLAAAAGPCLGLSAQAPRPGGACTMAPLEFVFCALGQASFIGAVPLGALLWTALARGRWHLGVWALTGAAMAWLAATLAAPLWAGAMAEGQATGVGVNSALLMLGLSERNCPWPWRMVGILVCLTISIACSATALPCFTLPFMLTMWLIVGIRNACSKRG